MTIATGPFTLGVSPLGTQTIGAINVIVTGGADVANLGAIITRVLLGDPGQASSYTTTNDAWTTVVTASILVHGAASSVMAYASWTGVKDGSGELRVRVQMDGVTVATGIASTLGDDEAYAMVVPILAGASAGTHALTLQMFVPTGDGDFVIDPTTTPVPGLGQKQASIIAREVPS